MRSSDMSLMYGAAVQSLHAGGVIEIMMVVYPDGSQGVRRDDSEGGTATKVICAQGWVAQHAYAGVVDGDMRTCMRLTCLLTVWNAQCSCETCEWHSAFALMRHWNRKGSAPLEATWEMMMKSHLETRAANIAGGAVRAHDHWTCFRF